MPTLKFKGFPHTEQYIGIGGVWNSGNKREVSDEQAAKLLADYPVAFESIGSAVSKPKKSRAVASPAKRGAASKAKKVTK